MDNERSERRSEWMWKLVVPIVVAVVGAVLVTALTPVGDGLREMLFPTEAVVSGSVTIEGRPASGATLVLDGEEVDAANEAGTFVLTGVGDGTHLLEAYTPYSERSESTFTIERGEETPDPLAPVVLEPLARLGYFLNRADIPVRDEQAYDFTLWIVADTAVLNRVDSVRYTLQSPFPSIPITVKRSGSAFCYRERGTIELTMTSSRPPSGVVTLRDGRAFPISLREGENAAAPSCPVTRTRGATGRGQTGEGQTGEGQTGEGQTGEGQTGESGGTEELIVPSVTGQPYGMAQSALQAIGFNTARQEVDSAQAAGIVVGQDPAAGTPQRKGTTVRLSVSRGPRTGTIPAVEALTEADAT
jgi:PASTA domain